MYGYTGQILHIDLTQGALTIEKPDAAFYRTYYGGSAMGLYYLLKHTPPQADPLGPDNTLSFFISAPTGVAISGQSRATATAKSPLTGLAGDAQSGGFWPAELKFAGFDGIVITGKSPKPVYVWINDGQPELRAASHLWGKDLTTGAVEQTIKAEVGESKAEVIQVGPAAEHGVRFAAIMNMSNRAFGRTGLGLVMASKNLKAIAVRGTKKPEVFDKQTIAEMNRSGTKEIPDNADVKGLQDYGTASVVGFQNSTGTFPAFNYNSGFFEYSDDISGEKMADTILKKNDTCFACTVRCKRVVETKYKDTTILPSYGGAEYETISTFGSYCGVNDLLAISLAHQICSEWGVDTIACGATIAFGMELFENGVITTEDTGGIELRFGNADAMIAMLNQIVRREGFGAVLAEGSEAAAQKIGRGAEEFLITVKGAELPAHMPQVKKSLALIYAVNPFGADHQSSEHDPMYAPDPENHNDNLYLRRLKVLGLTNPQKGRVMNEEKVRFAYRTQLNYSFLDTATLCQFVWGPAWTLFGPEQEVALMKAVTGWDVTIDEIQTVGERRLNLLRAFNAREGVGRDKDTLPKKVLSRPLKGGRSDGRTVTPEELDFALNTYYELAGWDKTTGMPTQAKLEELGLGWIQ
ncbi:MAG TPA: aldehyde ferredoxin oxidoreductase family protein [Anaerolineae bacterium]|nr:aldehyde ferredoxin oxidoreductase family protein [Anaerolineae bacterium]